MSDSFSFRIILPKIAKIKRIKRKNHFEFTNLQSCKTHERSIHIEPYTRVTIYELHAPKDIYIVTLHVYGYIVVFWNRDITHEKQTMSKTLL